MDARQRQDLDRHITGNYGEDQFRRYSGKGRKSAPEGCACGDCRRDAEPGSEYCMDHLAKVKQ